MTVKIMLFLVLKVRIIKRSPPHRKHARWFRHIMTRCRLIYVELMPIHYTPFSSFCLLTLSPPRSCSLTSRGCELVILRTSRWLTCCSTVTFPDLQL